jgi:hypothetical protein
MRSHSIWRAQLCVHHAYLHPCPSDRTTTKLDPASPGSSVANHDPDSSSGTTYDKPDPLSQRGSDHEPSAQCRHVSGRSCSSSYHLGLARVCQRRRRRTSAGNCATSRRLDSVVDDASSDRRCKIGGDGFVGPSGPLVADVTWNSFQRCSSGPGAMTVCQIPIRRVTFGQK